MSPNNGEGCSLLTRIEKYLEASARDLAPWRRGNPGQGRIRHKQHSPHPAAAGWFPSIYSGPHIDLAFPPALKRVLYFAFGSYSLVSRE
jgi:hypothetical protein